MRTLVSVLLAGMPVASNAVTLSESFETNPFTHGWSVHGDTNLFQWDATNHDLRVTWDSSRTNSFCHLPLNNLLTRADTFEASFDVYLEDITVGTTAGKPDTFPIAISVFNLSEAQRTNFFIGTGVTGAGAGIRSAFEFDYFPDAGFGDTFAAIAVSRTPTNYSQFLFDHDYPTPMDLEIWHRITLTYTGSSQNLTLTKTRSGQPYGTEQSLTLDTSFGDFRMDAFAISSYNDKIGLGSVRAHGRIDNIVITLPERPVSTIVLTLTNGVQAHFQAHSNWTYTLERREDSPVWLSTSITQPGDDGPMTLTDTNAPHGQAFYRVRAERQ